MAVGAVERKVVKRIGPKISGTREKMLKFESVGLVKSIEIARVSILKDK